MKRKKLRVTQHAADQFRTRARMPGASHIDIVDILTSWWHQGSKLTRLRHDLTNEDMYPNAHCRRKGDFVLIAVDDLVVTVMVFNPQSYAETVTESGTDPRWAPLKALRKAV